ncbi:hypothetical protein D3C86_1750530 [compost metagenome]
MRQRWRSSFGPRGLRSESMVSVQRAPWARSRYGKRQAPGVPRSEDSGGAPSKVSEAERALRKAS